MSTAAGGVVVVGDSLLDRDIDGEVERVCPDAPVPVLEESSSSSRPGGAALAAALAAVMTGPAGPPVTLVTARCSDAAGDELADLLGAAGVEVVTVPAAGSTTEKIRLRSGGQSLLRLDRGTATATIGSPPDSLGALLRSAATVLVADYGRGMTSQEQIRRLLTGCGRPLVWDPHPRGADPVPDCRVVTPNAAELAARTGTAAAGGGPGLSELVAAARAASRDWRAAGVAVTRGPLGALFVTGEQPPLAAPPAAASDGDTCGAGDCFSASVAVHLAAGALPSEAVTAAVADAGRFVAAGAASAYSRWIQRGAATPFAPHPDRGTQAGGRPGRGADTPQAMADRVRRSGGTLVAAGGCFDILHAGHVALLQAARRLGDGLIVCMNSDRSVRRLKGPGRPLNPAADRAATLSALDCVDAVEVFDEDTPEQVIRRLRPDVWVKGGDYDARSLPESASLAEWGGQAVVLPYLAGRSTSGLLERAAGPAR